MRPPTGPVHVGETCVILHGKLRQLVAAGEWDDAADVGARAFALVERCAPDLPLLAELARLCLTLAPLGMLIDRPRLVSALGRVLSVCSDDAPLADAVAALRTACGYSLPAFLAALPSAQRGGRCSLALFRAVTVHLDAESATPLLRLDDLAHLVQAGLCSTDAAARFAALDLLGRMLVRAPLALCGQLVPILTCATLYESSAAAQDLSLAALADAAYMLARARATDETQGVAAEQLLETVELLQGFLYAPKGMTSRIAVLGLAKLVLDERCCAADSLLAQCIDAEGILADLAFRRVPAARARG